MSLGMREGATQLQERTCSHEWHQSTHQGAPNSTAPIYNCGVRNATNSLAECCWGTCLQSDSLSSITTFLLAVFQQIVYSSGGMFFQPSFLKLPNENAIMWIAKMF